MKKIYLIITALALGVTLSACQSGMTPTQSGNGIIEKEIAVVENQLSTGVLVAYLPHMSQASVGSDEAGNDIGEAARTIGDITGGALFNIGEEDGPSEDYGTVFLGLSSQLPEDMELLRMYLEKNDLSGKTIIPFLVTDDGDWGGLMENLYEWEPDSEFLDGTILGYDSISITQAEVSEWLSGLGYNK